MLVMSIMTVSNGLVVIYSDWGVESVENLN
jgi:hypothetical protein